MSPRCWARVRSGIGAMPSHGELAAPQQRANADSSRIMQLVERLARWSETPQGLTCTYLSDAHRAVAAELGRWMREAGLRVEMDALGNVVGRYDAESPTARTLLIGSHYDTVRDAGKYDGRLGLVTALVVAERLQRMGRRLPFNIDVVAFSEEEGVRFAASFIGSSAMAG